MHLNCSVILFHMSMFNTYFGRHGPFQETSNVFVLTSE